MKYLRSIAAAALVALTASAQAELYSFETNPGTGGALGNNAIHEISSTFDDANQRFTWNTTFNPMPSMPQGVDGFWLVVNNGPNPKSSDVNELAIMYGDLSTGTLSTYVYNGQNSATSINNPGILIQTDTFDTATNGFSLDISTAGINSFNTGDADYSGVSFDAKIGIWFHFSTGSEFTYDAQGNIVDYGFERQGWYDVANLNASVSPSPVSSPSLIALFGLGIAGLMVRRRQTS